MARDPRRCRAPRLRATYTVLQLVQGRGSYELRLTVTRLRGATSCDWIRIHYVSK
jgi:hypothetical protein